MRVTIIGGANVDISARSYSEYVPEDKNPGEIYVTFGGVGRNVAHNLRLMGIQLGFITAFGNDLFARPLVEHCKALGMDLSQCKTFPGSTGMYININDNKGNLKSAVSQMDIVDNINEVFLAGSLDYINSSSAVFFDTNLKEEAIRYLMNNVTAPLFSDGVSSGKVIKLKNVLKEFPKYPLHTVKVNALEAGILTDTTVNSVEDAKRAGECLHKKGIKNVFITLGADGVFCMNGRTTVHVPAIKPERLNVIGAGDAFMAGTIYGFTKGKSLQDCAVIGTAMSKITLEDPSAVSENINETAVFKLTEGKLSNE